MMRTDHPALSVLVLVLAGFLSGLADRGLAQSVSPEKIQAILEEGMETNLVVVYDTSGSMRERPGSGEEEPKLQIARRALTKFLQALPPAVKVGLIYFHGCQPQWVAQPGALARSALIEKVGSLRAMGSTPIAAALRLATSDLAARLAKNGYGHNVILLVTDGEETCAPPADVIEAAGTATKGNIELHAIGFDLPNQDTDLKRVATKYYRAGDSSELSAGLSTVQAELSMEGKMDAIGGGK